MAWAHVSNDNPGTDTFKITSTPAGPPQTLASAFTTANNTTGNFIVVWVSVFDNTTTAPPSSDLTVTDNASGGTNTYTQLIFNNQLAGGTAQVAQAIFIAKIVRGGGTKLTITASNNNANNDFLQFCAAEFSGGSTNKDVSATNSGTVTDSPTPGAITTTNAGDLIVSNLIGNQNNSITKQTDFTDVGNSAVAPDADAAYWIPGVIETATNEAWTSSGLDFAAGQVAILPFIASGPDPLALPGNTGHTAALRRGWYDVPFRSEGFRLKASKRSIRKSRGGVLYFNLNSISIKRFLPKKKKRTRYVRIGI